MLSASVGPPAKFVIYANSPLSAGDPVRLTNARHQRRVFLIQERAMTVPRQRFPDDQPLGFRAGSEDNLAPSPIQIGEILPKHVKMDLLMPGVFLTGQGWSEDRPAYWVCTVEQATKLLVRGEKLESGAIVDPCLPESRRVELGEWFIAVHMMFSEAPKIIGTFQTL